MDELREISKANQVKKSRRAAQLFVGQHSLEGYCVEASVVCVEYLRRRGFKCKLIRRLYKDYDDEGHWTFDVEGQEFDPDDRRLVRGPAG